MQQVRHADAQRRGDLTGRARRPATVSRGVEALAARHGALGGFVRAGLPATGELPEVLVRGPEG
jgi:hypothetical protein